jgi:hypothetical protein
MYAQIEPVDSNNRQNISGVHVICTEPSSSYWSLAFGELLEQL